MLFTILFGFLSTLLLVPLGHKIKSKWSMVLPLIPASLFLYYLAYVPAVAAGSTFSQMIDWVPSLGVNFDFRLDGLSLYSAY